MIFLKLDCAHCHHTLEKEITHHFESYTIGQVECPFCHLKQQRYLSALDIFLYFAFSSLLYSLGLVLVVLLMNRYGTTLLVIAVALILVVIMYFLMKLSCLLIYQHAFFKKEWKETVIQEDAQTVQRKGKREFWIYMALAFLFATQRILIQYYPLVVLLFIMTMAGQILHLIKKEQRFVREHKG